MPIRFTTDQRRTRLVARHGLGAPVPAAAGPLQVARDLVALHSTDPATVYLSVAARAPIVPEDLQRALYEERTLVRMLGMRRTVFVVPVDVAPAIQAGCAEAIAVNQRRLLLALLTEAKIPDGADGPVDPAAWLDEVADSAVHALAARGEATAAALCVDEPRLRTQVTVAEGKAYGGRTNITSRVLFLLAAQGRIVRGRPGGSWLSTQYRWSTVDRWWSGGLPSMGVAAARVELARRWLSAYGPATVADLKWWTGWTLTETRRALGQLSTLDIDLDGAPGVLLESDVDSEPEREPRAVLLPALDPTVMGWAGREWYLGGHAAALFDRSGNAGPTVWWGGKVIGGWAQRADGTVVTRLLEDAGRAATRAVDAAAASVQDWLGEVRVTPRFRTPLERELSA